ncbi:MAG: helix-turn-helix transcriptional regulator [Nitrospira sp.]|nr:helix-turn-helix transcriptional regulator [bacterium]MBL7050457.1 helix-turn-helix transcriptional regulator [Nitrospira sp.]
MLTFGDNILLWRLHRSLSQEQLAVLSNIPRPNLSDIEKGKRDITLSTIRSLARALNVSPGTLADANPPKPDKWKNNLTRESMERIAGAAARGTSLKNPLEDFITVLLKEVLRCSLVSTQSRTKSLPLPGRSSNRAWLHLRALYPAETLESLIMRTKEHAELLWISDR